MVVAVGQHAVAAFLDDAVVHARAQHDLCRRRVPTTAASAGRQRELRNGGTTLVLQRYRLLTVLLSNVAVEERACLYLAYLSGNGTVLHGVRAPGIERLVHLGLVDREADVALAVGSALLPVQRYALHCSATAEVVPAALALPGRQVGSGKLLGLIFSLRHFKGNAPSLGAQLLFHGLDGCGQRVVACFEGIDLAHVDGVSAARAAGLGKRAVLFVPCVEHGAKQVEFVLLYLLSVLGEVEVSALPVAVILPLALSGKHSLGGYEVHTGYRRGTLLLNGGVCQYAVKARRGSVQGLYCHIFVPVNDLLGGVYSRSKVFRSLVRNLRDRLCFLCLRVGIGGSLYCFFRRGICRLLGCLRLCCRIGGRLAQQTYRSRYQFFATHCGECLHTSEA